MNFTLKEQNKIPCIDSADDDCVRYYNRFFLYYNLLY